MNNPEKRIFLSCFVSMMFILLLVLIHFFEVEMSLDFHRLGVFPRKPEGLVGIITHPLIHSSWKHLATNSVSLFILLSCLLYFYKDWAYAILSIIWVGTGIILFLIGRASWHIGASGIIYGMAFFFFFSGIFSKTKYMIAISLLIAFLYGSMVWSITPHFVKPEISWEGHLAGAVMGIITAIFFYDKAELAKIEERTYNDEEDEALYEKWVKSLEPASETNPNQDTCEKEEKEKKTDKSENT